MSIQSEINRLNKNVKDSYNALSAIGVTTSNPKNSNNLPDTITATTGVIDSKIAVHNDSLAAHSNLFEGKLDKTALPAAIEKALAQAKASGDFKGDPGPQGLKGDTGPRGPAGAAGKNGSNGVSCTHSWSGTKLTVTSASGTSTADLKGEKGDRGEPGAKGDTGAAGKNGSNGAKGDKGEPGAKGDTGSRGPAGSNGISCTHRWSGTTLFITSASGTTSANLKGDKGDPGKNGGVGPQGPAGPAGKNGLTTSISLNGTTYTQSGGKITLPTLLTPNSVINGGSW